MSSGAPAALLAANVGNTATKLGLIVGRELVWRLRAPHGGLLAAFEAARGALPAARPERLVSGSVRPDVAAELDALAARLSVPHQGVDRRRLAVLNRTRAPERVGIDRLLNARAALERGRCEWLLIDCGTAITVDRVSEDGAFLGGAIAPGAGLAGRALHEGTALLPPVTLQRVSHALGRDTDEALSAGLYWGFRGLVRGLVDALRREAEGPLRLLVTGGDGALLGGDLGPESEQAPDLTLEGIGAYAAHDAPELTGG